MQSAEAGIQSAKADGLRDLSRRRRSALLAVSLVALPAVILAGAWRMGGVSALEDDLLYYLPIRQYIGERIWAGELPLWNPLVGMGASLAADPQSGLWYPPTYGFAVMPPLLAYSVTVILHFALAGWGMYRFLRALGRDWQSAFVGALAFEFCGYLIAHRAHLTIFQATAWVPWILFGWQRFAATGRFRHFMLAVLAFGLQSLVQHTQVSIMTVVLVSAYAAFVLIPGRWRMLWQYPLGMTIGAGLAAVQVVPTALHLANSGRATPTYATFIENSWVPSSALMLLFPMLYGNRTPTFWGQSWWGFSHFCEQFAYGSVAMLVLAVASMGLVFVNERRDTGNTLACTARGLKSRLNLTSSMSREVVFWWTASLAVLVIALGDLTPVGRWLFHVPIYRNLRVPARWILVWSLAMPILGSAVMTSIHQGGPVGERLGKTLRRVGTRILPVAAILCLAILLTARLLAGRLEMAYGDRWGVATMLAGLRTAVRLGNPAIIWPLVVMSLSVAALLYWLRRRDGRSCLLLVMVMLVDLAGVAAFADVDWTTYRRAQLTEPPPLAKAIRDADPDPGHRLLVPRYQADYRSPIEVLWPQTNMRQGVSTFNAYGPFWPKANRLLFRFMPWGSSEGMLELLRNRHLCAAMGIRYIASRSPEESAIVQAALAPAVEADSQDIAGYDDWTPVRYGKDLLWPVITEKPGIYRLRFEARPTAGSSSQWFVRLETLDGGAIGWTRRLEPVDLSGGPRTMEFMFECQSPGGPVAVRIKAEMGEALSVRQPRFQRVASASDGEEKGPGSTGGEPALQFWKKTTDNVEIHELDGAAPLMRLASDPQPVRDLSEAIDRLLVSDHGQPAAVFEWNRESPAPQLNGKGRITYRRISGNTLRAEVSCDMESLLIFNETFDPGWRVTVNGQPAEVLRVNAVVQGVIVPKGKGHAVEWRYHPEGLYIGLAISLASLLALVLSPLAGRQQTCSCY